MMAFRLRLRNVRLRSSNPAPPGRRGWLLFPQELPRHSFAAAAVKGQELPHAAQQSAQKERPPTAAVCPKSYQFKAVNNRDKNFTRAKMERRLAQIEESVARYLASFFVGRCPFFCARDSVSLIPWADSVPPHRYLHTSAYRMILHGID
jgi:hypothetical protein